MLEKIKTTPHQGWAEACKKAASRLHEDDSVICDDMLDEENSANV